MSQIAENLKAIQKKMARVAEASINHAQDVHLVAVSKYQSMEKIEDALHAGLRIFGENRVQEAAGHWRDLRKNYPDLCLHLIGSLQTNKAAEAVALFDVIETVDRPKLAQALAEEMKEQKRHLPCFIQVNTGEEPQKSGVFPADLPVLLTLCRDLGLDIQGLMCIPPENEPAALHFAFLKKLARRHGLKELSMGMSSDFEKAIPLGATYIRLGTALFGAREG